MTSIPHLMFNYGNWIRFEKRQQAFAKKLDLSFRSTTTLLRFVSNARGTSKPIYIFFTDFLVCKWKPATGIELTYISTYLHRTDVLLAIDRASVREAKPSSRLC
jgi:hypothetical protein